MNKSELIEKLKILKSALIFCHARPDGDTLSSAFSLKMAFEKMGKCADVVCADKIPEKYVQSGLVGTFDEPKEGYDAHISVDCASEGQIGSLFELFRSNRETFAIDHHISNTRYAKYSYVCDECANAVNIFEIVSEMGVQFDEKLASTLYLGLCTDSGNFSQSNTDQKAFEVAAKLVSFGANPAKIYNAMFKNQSAKRAKLYAHVMSGIKLFHDDRLAIITTRQSDLEKFGVSAAENEGFIDFPLTIGSVEIAVSILEKEDKRFKISFRSKNYVDVNALAGTFGGGGHTRASGAMISGYYEDVLDKLVFTCGNYLL